MKTSERETTAWGGWSTLIVLLLTGIGLGYLTYYAITHVQRFDGHGYTVSLTMVWLIVACGLAEMVWMLLLCGFFTLQPNMGAVLTLFGRLQRHGQGEAGFTGQTHFFRRRRSRSGRTTSTATSSR